MILKRLIFLVLLMSLAITACYTNVTRTAKTSDLPDQQNLVKTSDPIVLSFNKSSFSESDTLNFSITNKSDSDIVISLRCGLYLEMAYQKEEDGHWSENMELWYMALRCPTHLYTIKPHEKYDFSLQSSRFNSKGSFRLLVTFNISSENIHQTITSVPFEIR